MARAALLLTVLLLAGCAAASGGGSPAVDVAGEWELVSGTAAGDPLPQPEGSRATLTFDGAEAGGQSFCNHYFSSYTLDGDALRFDGIGGTEMACEPEIMAAETAFVTALGAVTRVARDGDDLLLTGDDVELRFGPVAPVPTSELVGTDWVLETLLDGEAASSVLGGSTLRFEDDGTLTATTACTTLTGRWQPTGDRIQLPEATGENRDCPPEAHAQDEHELAVLGGGFSPTIEEDRLTLLIDDGRGLVYRDAGPGPDGRGGGTGRRARRRLGDAVGHLRGRGDRHSRPRPGERSSSTAGGSAAPRSATGSAAPTGSTATSSCSRTSPPRSSAAWTTSPRPSTAFHGVLNGAGLSVTVDAMELVLTSDAGELRFTPVPPVPEAELVGTRWVLETVAQGGTASAAVGEPAVLELREDGTATFSTGCQTMTGTWTTHGDSVILADHAYDPIRCPPAVGRAGLAGDRRR